jgi:hypothetical protein
MDLKRMLRGTWFTRLVLISWIISAVSIFIVFKNMELIVHGQLYSYGLVFSADWADPYRVCTWLIYLCLGLPMALSGLALVTSFLKVEKLSVQKNAVSQKLKQPQRVPKVESPQVAKEAPKRVTNVNGVRNGNGLSCPSCKKVFGRALVMLDFHNGKNQLVSVCPYCNHVLGNKVDEKSSDETFHVIGPDEKIIQ